MELLKFLITFFSFIVFYLTNLLSCELRFVYEVIRHGARSPHDYLDKDNKDIFGQQWTLKGELTEVGMRQQYLLGYKHRQKYNNYLSKTYDPKEVFVMSTDYNRTIMSALSHLQGLYSNEDGAVLSQEQVNIAVPPISDFDFESEKLQLGNFALPNQMQMIPVHIVFKNRRTLLYDEGVCPTVKKMKDKNLEKKVFKDFAVKFNNTWGEKLFKILNVTDPHYFFNHYNNLYIVCDAFMSGYIEGYRLNILTEGGIDLEQFKETANEFLTIDNLEYQFGDPDMFVGRMSMGFFMQDIVKYMNRRIKKDIKGETFIDYSAPKLVIYSAHETTLGAFQTYFKAVFNTTKLYYAPNASTLLIELYRRDNVETSKLTKEDYYVTAQFNDYLLFNLTYSDFMSEIKTKSVSQSKINKFCGFTSSSSSFGSINPFIFTFIFLLLLFSGLVTYIVKVYFKKNRNEFIILDNTL